MADNQTYTDGSEVSTAPCSLSLLLVEDDDVIERSLTRYCNRRGHSVHHARTAEEARKLLPDTAVDCILLEIMLPEASGVTFMKELRREDQWSDIPVVILTNLDQEEQRTASMEAGADDYIIKARTLPSDIVQRVETLCCTDTTTD